MRNRDAILAVLKTVLPPEGLVLEVASGTGEHAAYMTPRLGNGIVWQPTDGDEGALPDIDAHARASGCGRIRPALRLDASAAHWPVSQADAILCCNMIHIAPWPAAEGLFAGAARVLGTPTSPLVLYGPFRRGGSHTADSNAAFDASLKARDARWGIRCLDQEVTPLAARHGLRLTAVHAMPANNLTAIFHPNR